MKLMSSSHFIRPSVDWRNKAGERAKRSGWTQSNRPGTWVDKQASQGRTYEVSKQVRKEISKRTLRDQVFEYEVSELILVLQTERFEKTTVKNEEKWMTYLHLSLWSQTCGTCTRPSSPCPCCPCPCREKWRQRFPPLSIFAFCVGPKFLALPPPRNRPCLCQSLERASCYSEEIWVGKVFTRLIMEKAMFRFSPISIGIDWTLIGIIQNSVFPTLECQTCDTSFLYTKKRFPRTNDLSLSTRVMQLRSRHVRILGAIVGCFVVIVFFLYIAHDNAKFRITTGTKSVPWSITNTPVSGTLKNLVIVTFSLPRVNTSNFRCLTRKNNTTPVWRTWLFIALLRMVSDDYTTNSQYVTVHVSV